MAARSRGNGKTARNESGKTAEDERGKTAGTERGKTAETERGKIAETERGKIAETERRLDRDVQRRRRIRVDLERRGVEGEFSDSICDRLAPFSEDLPPELYDAVLSGVAMAHGVQQRGTETLRDGAREIAEVERLLSSFVGELRKLDESLETLAAYVARLRDNVSPAARGTVH